MIEKDVIASDLSTIDKVFYSSTHGDSAIKERAACEKSLCTQLVTYIHVPYVCRSM